MVRENTRRNITLLVGALVTASLVACSVIVSTNGTQCQVDSDCAMFAHGSTCDPAQHICLVPASTSSGSSGSSGPSSSSSGSGSSSSGASCNVDGGIAGGGCYACTPTDNDTLLNACTTGCIDFDNSRVKGLLDGGGLPLLPMPGPDGGM